MNTKAARSHQASPPVPARAEPSAVADQFIGKIDRRGISAYLWQRAKHARPSVEFVMNGRTSEREHEFGLEELDELEATIKAAREMMRSDSSKRQARDSRS
jgi:hypothetical protein